MPEFQKSKQRDQKSRAVKSNKENVWLRAQQKSHPSGSETLANRTSVIINTDVQNLPCENMDINNNLQSVALADNHKNADTVKDTSSNYGYSESMNRGKSTAKASSRSSWESGAESSGTSLQAKQMTHVPGIRVDVSDGVMSRRITLSEASLKTSSFEIDVSDSISTVPQSKDPEPQKSHFSKSSCQVKRTTSVPAADQMQVSDPVRLRSLSRQSRRRNDRSDSRLAGSRPDNVSEQHRTWIGGFQKMVHGRHRNASDVPGRPDQIPFLPPPSFNFPGQQSFNRNVIFPNGSHIPHWNFIQHQRPPVADTVQQRQSREHPSYFRVYQSNDSQFSANKHKDAVKDRLAHTSNQRKVERGNWRYNRSWHSKYDKSAYAEGTSSLSDTGTFNSQIEGKNENIPNISDPQSSHLYLQGSENRHTRRGPTKRPSSHVTGERNSRYDLFQSKFQPLQTSENLHCNNSDNPLSEKYGKQKRAAVLPCHPENTQTSTHLSFQHSIGHQRPNPYSDHKKFVDEIWPPLGTKQHRRDETASKTSPTSQLISSEDDTVAKQAECRSHHLVNCNAVHNNNFIARNNTETQNPSWNQPRSAHLTDRHNTPHTSKGLEQNISGRTGNNVECQQANTPSAFQTLPPFYDPTVHPSQVFPACQGLGHDIYHGSSKMLEDKPPSSTLAQCLLTPHNSNGRFSNYRNGTAEKHENKTGEITESKQHKDTSNGAAFVNPSKEIHEHYVQPNNPLNSTKLDGRGSRVEQVHVEHNGNHQKLNPDVAPFSLDIRNEIEEEMARAQNMLIPVKIDSKKSLQMNTSLLNPDATEFSPAPRDCYGNPFVMTKDKGVCYFQPDVRNWPFYEHLIPTDSDRNPDVHNLTENTSCTPGPVFESYVTENYDTSNVVDNIFSQAYEQQMETTQYTRLELPIWTGQNRALTEVSTSNMIPHVMWSTDTELPRSFVSPNFPESTQSNENHMHLAAVNSYLHSPYGQANSTFIDSSDPYHLNHTPNELSTPEEQIQSHTQTPYAKPGYGLYSFLPMYITPSPVAATPILSHSGTECCPFFLQTQPVPGITFSVPVPAHMVASHMQPPYHSAPEHTLMRPTQHSWSQAPVFNLQAYFETTQEKCAANADMMPDVSSASKDTSHETNGQCNFRFHAKNPQTETDGNMYQEDIKSTNELDNTKCLETWQDNLNNAKNVVNSTLNLISEIDDFELGHRLPLDSISSSVEHDASPNVYTSLIKDIGSVPEFEECRRLLETLTNKNIALDLFQHNLSSEPDIQRHMMEKWLELALRVVEGSGNALTVDEMAAVMLPSLQSNSCATGCRQDVPVP